MACEEPLGDEEELLVEPVRERPRVSVWLWQPSHAKLWWSSSGLYWAGMLASYWSVDLDQLYGSVLAGYLNVAFFPFTVLGFLGVGYVHALMDYKGLEWGPATHEQLFPKRSVGGWRDPASDPLDPRSGARHLRHMNRGS